MHPIFNTNDRLTRPAIINKIIFGSIEHTLFLESSWRRKLNNRDGETLSQREVLKTTVVARGLPGSSTLFLIITLTSSEPGPEDICIHEFPALISAQKLLIILSARFRKLVLPACGIKTVQIKRNKHKWSSQTCYILVLKIAFDTLLNRSKRLNHLNQLNIKNFDKWFQYTKTNR